MLRKQVLFLITLILTPVWALAEPAPFTFDSQVALSMVRGEIPAPIETTRFQIGTVDGTLQINLEDIQQTTGTIKVDLRQIKSYSFDDPSKNSKQTEHMLNWFEIGPDVSTETRTKNRWAVFTVKEIIKKSSALQPKDEIGTATIYQAIAKGDLTVHGITKPKEVDLTVVIYTVDPDGSRYKEAKRVALIKTASPLTVSLKEHDVKPRDAAGTFLAKALSVVGLKIADTAEIDLDLRAFQKR